MSSKDKDGKFAPSKGNVYPVKVMAGNVRPVREMYIQ